MGAVEMRAPGNSAAAVDTAEQRQQRRGQCEKSGPDLANRFSLSRFYPHPLTHPKVQPAARQGNLALAAANH